MWQNCLLVWCTILLLYNLSNLSCTLKSFCILYHLHIIVIKYAIQIWEKSQITYGSKFVFILTHNSYSISTKNAFLLVFLEIVFIIIIVFESSNFKYRMNDRYLISFNGLFQVQRIPYNKIIIIKRFQLIFSSQIGVGGSCTEKQSSSTNLFCFLRAALLF